MAHDEHFLQRLDRVTREHVEVALGLYRDHAAVRLLLRANGVTADGDRVAIALADGGRGPHVIVAADGAFVTCLGEGMSTGPWRVIPRTKTDGLLRQLADHRKRRAVAEKIARPGEDDNDLLARIGTRKNRLSREELVGISAFAPLFAEELYMLGAEAGAKLHQGAQAKLPFKKGYKAAELTDAHARLTWSAAHGMELCGLAGRDMLAGSIRRIEGMISFSMPTTFLVDHTFLLRGIWAAAKIGKVLLPSYRERLENAGDSLVALDAALGLLAIALRHSHTTDEVERLFRRFAGATIDSFEVGLRAEVSGRALRILDNRDQMYDNALELGAITHAEATMRRLPEGDPDRIESAADVPAELAETAFLTTHGAVTEKGYGLVHPFAACTILARVSAEAFHYPAALVSKLVEPWGPGEAARHNEQMRSVSPKPVPLKYVARFGRNDPCPCGSGKKFKKCCLEC